MGLYQNGDNGIGHRMKLDDALRVKNLRYALPLDP
jgi:hypothetical protein